VRDLEIVYIIVGILAFLAGALSGYMIGNAPITNARKDLVVSWGLYREAQEYTSAHYVIKPEVQK